MQLLAIFVLTTIIHAVDTGSFAARLAGVRSGRLALSNSLYSVLNLISRGANTLAGPLIGVLTDTAANQQDTADLLTNYRVMLLAATVGTVIAALLIPTLSRLLERGVLSYEQRRSLPRVIVRGASVRGVRWLKMDLTPPRLSSVRQSRHSPFPKRFLTLSVLTTAFFTVSNFAALYASALAPQGARTATSLAPIFTGFFVFVSIFFLNPVVALIVDEGVRGERPVQDTTYITIWQIGARLIGTLLAQLLLGPMGLALAELTNWLVN